MTEQIETIEERCARLEGENSTLLAEVDALGQRTDSLVDDVDDLQRELAGLREDATEAAPWRAAAHMLHEQAHGKTPFRFCQSEPCRDLYYETGDAAPQGPAPLTLVGTSR